jgi:hypothetical protein
LKRAFLCSSCWALAPVLNEFIVSTAFGDVDYSSNVGMAEAICDSKPASFLRITSNPEMIADYLKLRFIFTDWKRPERCPDGDSLSGREFSASALLVVP